MKRAIEEYFPIVDINRLAVPERNAFKPIYTMHKWFARRSSSVFRAVLLGALKPAGTDIMSEFYKDHTNDSDTSGKVILDPFMGGGTTVVEALRLGCKVIGVDLNPVAWFIVKTEVEPVDLKELQAAFDRLANRTVEWSGKPLKETLLSLYKTECPECGNKNADIIYTFWVKFAPCTTGMCNHLTPLFSDYIISQKKPSIRYFPDCTCPNCLKTFDWEIDSASLVGVQKLMVNSPGFSAGEGRSNVRWAHSSTSRAECPWCNEIVVPLSKSSKTKRKKVPLSILYCPSCEEVWQYRGELADDVQCPSCNQNYNPKSGNIPEKGKFICRGSCGGNVDAIIAAIRMLPEDQVFKTQPYAIEGHCKKCAGLASNRKRNNDGLFEGTSIVREEHIESNSNALLKRNNGKFYKRISTQDILPIGMANSNWKKYQEVLPYPKSKVPSGQKTKTHLLGHHYHYWHQLFNTRQLLALSTLLNAIMQEEKSELQEHLLSAFFNTLNNMSDLTSYRTSVGASRQVFARHDYHPKLTPCEVSVWGTEYGMGNFPSMFLSVMEGKKFNLNTYDRRFVSGNRNEEEVEIEKVTSREVIDGRADQAVLQCASSTSLSMDSTVDVVITDPPYASNVDYSELADYFYVWIRLVLAQRYSQFLPEYTPKAEEIVQNPTRGKTIENFRDGLTQVFTQCYQLNDKGGLLVFTFHHADDQAWEALIESICGSGHYLEAVYPIHGEAESSLHLMDNEAISYDLIHVCRKRDQSASTTRKSWATIKQDIRRRSREEARLIESGRYGNEPLTPADINILLIGKCLELYSRYYGTIIDHEDRPVPLRRALEEIKMLVDQLVAKDRQIPTELEDLDVPSYIYFSKLCGYKEISGDELSKSTRGIIDLSMLKESGLIIKGRENRGRSFEVKLPIERMNILKPKFVEKISDQGQLFVDDTSTVLTRDILFVDCVQYLIGLAELGEQVLPWLERFSGLRPQIRAALDWLINYPGVSFKEPAKKVLNLMDERTLFTNQG